MSEKTNANSGLGFWGALQIVFIVLKLTDVIDWSWWWVMSPMIASFFLLGVFLLIFAGVLFWERKA